MLDPVSLYVVLRIDFFIDNYKIIAASGDEVLACLNAFILLILIVLIRWLCH